MGNYQNEEQPVTIYNDLQDLQQYTKYIILCWVNELHWLQ